MGEIYTLHDEILSTEQFKGIERIGSLATRTVEESFGSGYPHFTGGHEGGLAYHNLHHTKFVMGGGERMADALGLGRDARAIVKLASAAHDIVQLKPRGIMEQESAEWLEDQLRQQDMPPAIMRAGSLAILGTEPVMDGLSVVGQKVDSLVFPDRVTELVAKSVASADLGELYDPYGPYHGHRLWQEIKGVAPGDPFPMEGIIDFQHNQVVLAQDYRFPHVVGEQVFGRLRSTVVRHQERILRELEAGNIASGEELLAADLAFAKQYSQE